MSQWKVSKEKIELFTHPDANALVIGKVGSYQVVVQKGLYNDGDEVIFAPEKSVLSGLIKIEFEKYLVGPNKDRVKAVRLRGEISSGVIIPPFLVEDMDQYELGEDISEKLGITHYEPPIPTQLAGKVKSFQMDHIGSHDCEHVGVYANELVQGERVVLTEKVHGSQFILGHDIEKDETIISSKGMLKKGLILEESDDNTYWIASKNDNLVEKIKNSFTSGVVQVFGEVIPVQKGYDYGQTKPTVRLFDIRHDGVSIPYDKVSDDFKELWVPIIFDGNIDLDKSEVVIFSDPTIGVHKTKKVLSLPKDIVNLCKGMEQVSGKQKHIREGVVLRPYIDRDAKDGTKLRLKIINPKYKETGEEIN